MARIPFINVDLDKVYDDMDFPLGAECQDEQGREFVFCKYNAGDGADTVVAGYLAVELDSAYPACEVTCDLNSGTIKAILNRPVGYAQAVFTDGKYGWFQKRGRSRQTVTTDKGVTQGDLLMPHATYAGTVDTHDAAAKESCGVALETDTDGEEYTGTLTAGKVFIDCP